MNSKHPDGRVLACAVEAYQRGRIEGMREAADLARARKPVPVPASEIDQMADRLEVQVNARKKGCQCGDI
jgi:hypothetical protein